MEVLQIENLSKSYGKIHALKSLTLNIAKGSVFGLLGPNGSGKTTTLAIILGILKHDSGSFKWFNGQYGEHYRLRIGAILETPNFYPYLNAIDNLKIISLIKKSSNDNFDELLDLVNLSHRKLSKFSTYSLGMKQRLAIAGALIGDPDVLIFDEPTNGLDPEGIAEVRHILKRVASTGKTVIMASHILDEVEKICSHVGILKNGSLLASGTIGSIINDDQTCEIAADDMEMLKSLLSNFSGIKSINNHMSFYECNISKEVTPTELNKYLFNNGIILNHLVFRKQRLEEEFLQIIKNKS